MLGCVRRDSQPAERWSGLGCRPVSASPSVCYRTGTHQPLGQGGGGVPVLVCCAAWYIINAATAP